MKIQNIYIAVDRSSRENRKNFTLWKWSAAFRYFILTTARDGISLFVVQALQPCTYAIIRSSATRPTPWKISGSAPAPMDAYIMMIVADSDPRRFRDSRRSLRHKRSCDVGLAVTRPVATRPQCNWWTMDIINDLQLTIDAGRGGYLLV